MSITQTLVSLVIISVLGLATLQMHQDQLRCQLTYDIRTDINTYIQDLQVTKAEPKIGCPQSDKWCITSLQVDSNGIKYMGIHINRNVFGPTIIRRPYTVVVSDTSSTTIDKSHDLTVINQNNSK